MQVINLTAPVTSMQVSNLTVQRNLQLTLLFSTGNLTSSPCISSALHKSSQYEEIQGHQPMWHPDRVTSPTPFVNPHFLSSPLLVLILIHKAESQGRQRIIAIPLLGQTKFWKERSWTARLHPGLFYCLTNFCRWC